MRRNDEFYLQYVFWSNTRSILISTEEEEEEEAEEAYSRY